MIKLYKSAVKCSPVKCNHPKTDLLRELLRSNFIEIEGEIISLSRAINEVMWELGMNAYNLTNPDEPLLVSCERKSITGQYILKTQIIADTPEEIENLYHACLWLRRGMGKYDQNWLMSWFMSMGYDENTIRQNKWVLQIFGQDPKDLQAVTELVLDDGLSVNEAIQLM